MISYLLLILSQLMVGVNIVGSKYLITHQMPIFLLLETRFIFATVILFVLSKLFFKTRQPKKIILTFNDWGMIIIQALCAGFFFNCLMLLGLRYTSANIAGVITSTLPLVIAIMSFLFLKEYLSPLKWLCIVIATCGLIIINSAKINSGNFQNTLLGDFIIFLALIPEAGYYLLAKIYQNKLPIMTISTWMNGINALIFIPFALFAERNTHYIDITFVDWGIALIIGLASALFYVFWYSGSAKVQITNAALYTAVMPVGTLIIAWIFLGEKLDLIQYVGMIFVLGAIILSVKIKQ